MKIVRAIVEMSVPRMMNREDVAQALESNIVAGSKEWGVGWDEADVSVVSVKQITADMKSKRLLGVRR